jgi:TonB family protein
MRSPLVVGVSIFIFLAPAGLLFAQEMKVRAKDRKQDVLPPSATTATPVEAPASLFCHDPDDLKRLGFLLSELPPSPGAPPAPTAAAAPATPATKSSPPKPGPGQETSDAQARGDLNKEIIRRVIRHHINEVKSCYEQELTQTPEIGGRVRVQFTIGASGHVIASSLLKSSVGNARLDNCVVQLVRHWEFPKPCGGRTIVASYPFVFTLPAPDQAP